VDSELVRLVSDLSDLSLHPQIEYAVESDGKRLRPILVLLSAQNVGGNRDNSISLALAFELMHTATLIHDDIIDQDETRRGRLALHKKWSVNDAILAGDALIALSINLASKYGERIIDIVSKCGLELCDGEHTDVNYVLKTATEESFFKMIKRKTASLFRDAAFCGALAGGATTSEALSFSKFGENLGIAYQLRDDLLDIVSSEEPIQNLKAQRVSLPLIRLYEKSDFKTRKQLERDLFAKEQHCSDVAIENVGSMLLQTDSIAYCREKIAEYKQKSFDSLRPLKENDYKSYLLQMADFLVL
jgi:geranylgeranyl pyrophosphate synthase